MPSVNAWQAMQNADFTAVPGWLLLLQLAASAFVLIVAVYIIIQLLREWWQDRRR